MKTNAEHHQKFIKKLCRQIKLDEELTSAKTLFKKQSLQAKKNTIKALN